MQFILDRKSEHENWDWLKVALAEIYAPQHGCQDFSYDLGSLRGEGLRDLMVNAHDEPKVCLKAQEVHTGFNSDLIPFPQSVKDR